MSCVDSKRTVGESEFTRRQLLRWGAVGSLVMALPRPAFLDAKDFLPPKRTLSLYNTHTDEHLTTVYWDEGRYCPQGLAAINHIMRDHRTGQTKTMDTSLLDLLFSIASKVKATEPFGIISGYRSPETNLLLHKKNQGVALNSLHMSGKAVDIQLPGCELSLLYSVAKDSRGGGVGYYPRSDFIHIDIGRVRYW